MVLSMVQTFSALFSLQSRSNPYYTSSYYNHFLDTFRDKTGRDFCCLAHI